MHIKTHLLKRVTRSSIIILVLYVLTACASTDTSTNSKSEGNLPKSDKALIHSQLARGYLQQKQYAVAKAELEKALRIDADHSDSNYVMGLLMLELKQYEEADSFLKKAVSSNRDNSDAAHDYGMFLCQTGREREAVDYFNVAVSNPLFKNAALSYMRAGECLSKIGDADAERYLKGALKINPRLRPALFRLAAIKYNGGSFLSARAYVERYLAITNPQPASLLLAYKIESELNADDVAASYRTKLLESFPASKEAGQLRNNQDRN